MDAPVAERAPDAIARTTGSLTAPCSASAVDGTPSSDTFTAFEYAITPPTTTSLRSGDRREPCAEQPAGAALGDGDRQPPLAAEVEHDRGEISAVLSVDCVADDRTQSLGGGGEASCGVLGRRRREP